MSTADWQQLEKRLAAAIERANAASDLADARLTRLLEVAADARHLTGEARVKACWQASTLAHDAYTAAARCEHLQQAIELCKAVREDAA